jgi:4-alpha-glucanotransferase
MTARGCGILLHITSLPSRFGIGDLGPAARDFLGFLRAAGQSYWQILPVGPTNPFIGNSPYSSDSAFAGNPVLISPEDVVAAGYLDQADLAGFSSAFDASRCDYAGAGEFKERLLRLAFARHGGRVAADPAFVLFCRENAHWLDDYALFCALKGRFGGAMWSAWPGEVAGRDPGALARAGLELAAETAYVRFVQYLFMGQWRALRAACREAGILLIGDAPIYVHFDSADVWASQRYFKLGEDRNPSVVAGVPPDYFSATGQRWGNPVYDWEALRADGYVWWEKRLRQNLMLFDYVRLDHFRGFEAYWEIPADKDTAVEGTWVKAPGKDFFTVMRRRFPCLPIIAEDLGVITPGVRELRDGNGFPGMVILLFAFGESMNDSPDPPHFHCRERVVYTGTHDNNTARGWFENESSPRDRNRFFEYVGYQTDAAGFPLALMRLALSSVADMAVVPMQDVLGLGSEGRMNMPSIAAGNWSWRMVPGQATGELAGMLGRLAALYGREA